MDFSKMMCPTFLFMICRGHSRMPRGRFVNDPYESLMDQGLLACFLNGNGNRNGHTDHGVVTCADETHHLDASVDLLEFRGE